MKMDFRFDDFYTFFLLILYFYIYKIELDKGIKK